MTPPLDINDCFLHDKDRLRHDEALDLLRANLPSVAQTESVDLGFATGRILAKPMSAPHAVPLHTNAAVDGYAFAHRCLNNSPLPVTSRIAAGDLSPPELANDHAARIFTGAPMPVGADTIAMQEDCHLVGKTVGLPLGIKKGANCRLAGEDLKSGDQFLDAGLRLKPADLAAAASVGVSKLTIREKLKVTLFSSGNELRRVGDEDGPLLAGQVWDANAPLLHSLLETLPVRVLDGGVIADKKTAVEDALNNAAQSSDLIVTTGGASRGDEDHMLAVLDRLGKRHLWQLAVKPGRPMMFGQIKRNDKQHDCFFFGLPGNPVAAMVCFLLYIRPSLLRLGGADWDEPVRYKVPANFELSNKKPDRREFLRGILRNDGKGHLTVDKFLRDGSGLISSLREADGLIEIDEETTEVQHGSLVNFIPFSGLF